jgi:hypothetical protein
MNAQDRTLQNVTGFPISVCIDFLRSTPKLHKFSFVTSSQVTHVIAPKALDRGKQPVREITSVT